MGKSQYTAIFIICALFAALCAGVCAQDGGRVFTAQPKPKDSKTDTKTKSNDRNNDRNAEKPSLPPKPKPIVPQMVRVPAGTFAMGSNRHRANEAPLHNVQLQSFEIAKYEVSNQEFNVFVTATGYKTIAETDNSTVTWRSYFTEGREHYPVVMVSWYDAIMFCRWLSEATGETFRLPTEAEWEYAARGGLEGKNYPWGESIDDEQANFDSEGESTLFTGVALEFVKAPGSYSANGFGLFDVAGNVAEWCQDWYSENFYASSPAANPLGPEKGDFKVIRGGGWISDANACRVSYRNFNSITFKMPYLGFRVVRVSR